MSYRVEVSDDASNEIVNIYQYLAFVVLAGEAAKKQVLRIEKAILSLSEMPERARAYDRGVWKDRNLRVLPVDNFSVFFLVDKEQQKVIVLHVYYGKRDLDHLV